MFMQLSIPNPTGQGIQMLKDFSLRQTRFPTIYRSLSRSSRTTTIASPATMATISTVSSEKEAVSGLEQPAQKTHFPPQKAVENGAMLVSAPEEKEWGQKVGYVRDIDGIVVRMGSHVARRLEKFKTTIFTQMSSLAIKHGAINLGQGFPNFDGPDFVKEAAIQAIREGKNQYARGYGVPDLNSAIVSRFKKDTGLIVNPEKEVTVTSGCTEAIAATMLGLINPGDEVIVFAPFYDSYEATLSMAGAQIKSITLRPPNFDAPLEELKSAISKNTRAILINTPHNPTGKMFTREELEFIATLCKENDVLVFTDEVYDKLAFEADHISVASLPGMYERTVTMNSLGKTFSLTGWKIGWAIAPEHLTWGVRQAHAFLTFATSTPMQSAAATALRAPDSYYEELKRDYMAKKAILVEGLKEVGFVVYPSSGTYFVIVDHTPFGFENDITFCEHLIKEVGVVAIPTSVFYLNPEDGKNLVRFTFCKDDETLKSAVQRMKEKLKKRC